LGDPLLSFSSRPGNGREAVLLDKGLSHGGSVEFQPVGIVNEAVVEDRLALNRPLLLAPAAAKMALASAIRLAFYLLLVAVVLVHSSQGRRRKAI